MPQSATIPMNHATEADSLRETVAGLDAQLQSLYDERANARYGLAEANAMVDSLEAQVAALLEERDALAARAR